MAIKKKAILTDNTTLPSLTPYIPPVFANIIATPFASGTPYKNPINVATNPNPLRPTQVNGFDLSVTQLRVPNPIYLNDLNGIFNLYSNFISDLFSGAVVQFSSQYLQNQITASVPLANRGYQQGAVLFSYPNLAWYQSIINNNVDTSLNSTTAPVDTTKWQQITLPYLPVISGTTTVPATTINFVGATVAANTTNANNAIVTISPPANPTQRIIFRSITTTTPTPYPTLNPPPGAIGMLLSATAFGGKGGNTVTPTTGGGGGGAGAGFRNLYYDLTTPYPTMPVSYNATTGILSITLPSGLTVTLSNGNVGTPTGNGQPGNANGGTGRTVFINPQPYATGGVSDAPYGGNGGASVLSNGQEVRALGGLGTGGINNGFKAIIFGGGGGGSSTYGSSVGGVGGFAAVIAEWVFSS